METTEDKRTRGEAAKVVGRRAAEAGFTIVELLVVMVILGLLAALVAPNFFDTGRKARVKITRTQISSLSTAMDAFGLDLGRYPSSQEGLEALLDAPSDAKMWDGPYMKKLPKDAWGNDFAYNGPSSGDDYEILSYGADGRQGGDDDASDISSND